MKKELFRWAFNGGGGNFIVTGLFFKKNRAGLWEFIMKICIMFYCIVHRFGAPHLRVKSNL